MRKKKREKLAEDTFWANFFYFNIPAHINEVPAHLDRVNFRYYSANDEDLFRMIEYVKSIYQLDLDETDVTDEGMKHLSQLDNITEIRLKGCREISDLGMAYICQFKGVELLHLYGTGVTTAGFGQIGLLTKLKTLIIEADINDPKLEEIYTALPPGCELIVSYKAYPF